MNNKILENLEVLRAAVAAEPTDLLDLNTFQCKADCGTLHCVLGLACTLPYFNEQGLRFDEDNNPILCGSGEADPVEASFMHIYSFDKLFGDDSWGNLFGMAGYGLRDGMLGYGRRNNAQSMTHKELALKRLDAEIDRHKEGVA